MGWLFSHPTRDALISELTANGETGTCTREVSDHHLVDNVLWQVVMLVPNAMTSFVASPQAEPAP